MFMLLLEGNKEFIRVLKITANDSFIFPVHEIDFIEVLADTGGNAIENAELYPTIKTTC
ncbi:hypothetical protein KHA80_16090 [Anaerobacillus sp. HL2]|nr:hypothetical protein KHA80_16090 [Anaerobacillus sp. HL2]